MCEDKYIVELEAKIKEQEEEIRELQREVRLLEGKLYSAYDEIDSLRDQYC